MSNATTFIPLLNQGLCFDYTQGFLAILDMEVCVTPGKILFGL